jgi:predicted Na+-dependent transporter
MEDRVFAPLIAIQDYHVENRGQHIVDSWSNSLNETRSSSFPIEIVIHVLLFFLVFGMSASTDTKALSQQMQDKTPFIIGLMMQFLIMPFLGFLSVFILKNHGLTTPMSITLLIVTASPGGSYSNMLCNIFRADINLSITMTSISTIMSVFMLPVNLLLYSQVAFLNSTTDQPKESIIEALDFPALFTSVGITIAAIVSGIFSSYKVGSDGSYQTYSKHFGNLSGVALLVVSIFFSSSNSSGGDSGDDKEEQTKLWNQDWSFYVAVAAPCLVGLVLATIIGKIARLDNPQVVALSVECSYQNIGIATSAATAMFDNKTDIAQALAVPLFYGLVEAVFVGIFCFIAWKSGWTYAPPNEWFCRLLVGDCKKEGNGSLQEETERTDRNEMSIPFLPELADIDIDAYVEAIEDVDEESNKGTDEESHEDTDEEANKNLDEEANKDTDEDVKLDELINKAE